MKQYGYSDCSQAFSLKLTFVAGSYIQRVENFTPSSIILLESNHPS